ncbi:glycosyltransferase 87 family protein [Streptomyces sp. NPDC004647]|uniref:glycosyltransferase 87 family protein n=1 Tax=Streptomyces sp. NPDC004647 TaxID=3154671 RepID=UPI0033A95BFA
MTGRASSSSRVLLVIGLTAATAVFLVTVPLHRDWFDVGVYYGTVNYWINDGGQIYDYLRPGTHYGFTYPPFAAVSMLPMALVSWPAAVLISIGLSVAAAAALLHWLAGPVISRQGWSRWFAFALAGCLFALLEPVRDTFSFGQVNLVLVALVFADARLLSTGRGRYAGAGIGLATAIKLTPAIFIGYLLVTRRWRQAALASGTAVAATLLGALGAPGASRAFWTEALWDTDRIGSLAYVSNQSVQGVLARLEPAAPSRTAWLVCVLVVLAVWAYRARRAAAEGDDWSGFALTGLAACLVSPITWVHHLVWLIPALAVLGDTALRRGHRGLLVGTVTLYVVLCSSLVWLWRWNSTGPAAFVGANAYVWISLALLVSLPVRPARETRPDAVAPSSGPCAVNGSRPANEAFPVPGAPTSTGT